MPLWDDIYRATLGWPESTDFLKSPIPKTETVFTALARPFETEEWIGLGRHRAVFRRGHTVVKVPVSIEGWHDNLREADRWRARAHPHLARCRLAGPLLVMVWCERYDRPAELLPRWTDAIDCQQVGRTRQGRLVAYDYAQRNLADPSS
jgi:hypothetical protein